MSTVKPEDRMKNPFWQRKMKHQFSCLDANKNGILSSDDFEILANRWIECGKLNQEQGKKVRTYVLGFWPAIGNGKEAVKEDEFLIGLSSVLGDEQKVRAIFDAYFDAIDTDNDGEISSKEFGVLLQSYGIDPTVAPEAFDGLDKNKDGIISRSEFIEAGTDYCQGIDEKSKSRYFFGLRF